MANDLTSNITRKLMRVFLKAFESNRVVTKTINTQLLSGKFNPSSGTTVDFKRPHDYRVSRTSDGDLTSETKSDILSGKATGTVQNYFTTATEWTNVQEALELDQLDQILAPMARRIVTDLEVDLAAYILKNCALSHGTVGTAATTWEHISEFGALMSSTGVPGDSPWYCLVSPFTQVKLAAAQKGLTAADKLVTTAWNKAQINQDTAGLRVLTSDALASYTTDSEADRAGTLSSAPVLTYVGAKDTMTQVLAVTALGAGATVIKAGDVVEITGIERLNLNTRQAATDETGAAITWRATVTADSTLTAGAGNITVAGPAIFETNGQYNTVVQTVAGTEVITVLGSASTTYKPNMFYHQQAFGMGTVKLPKLFSTDTVATTSDGFSIRVSKYSDGDTNIQKVRFDLLPAYATFNPFLAGSGWGT